MKFKEILKWLSKAFLAGFVAIIILTIFSMLYYNHPIHYPNESGATDYAYNHNAFYSVAREGISFGKTNNEGFNNGYNYEKKMNINVLLMGSSHMEGYQIFQKENAASLLKKLMPQKNIYNIGMAGHNFLTCCSNFKSAVEKYHPSEYVIIETSTLNFSKNEIKQVLDQTYPELANHSEGILGLLSKNQFLRLVYVQSKNFTEKSDADVTTNYNQSKSDNTEVLNNLLSYIGNIAKDNNIKLIIFYHPTTQINSDGQLVLPDDERNREEFEKLARNNNIIFMDMTERFKYEYRVNHILPYGFNNSSMGSGHLNKYGHNMVADELYKIIKKEGEK